MDFLDHLAPAPGPVAAKTTARKPSAAMPAATRPAAAKAAVSGAARGVAGRGTKKNDQTMMIYIGGGIAAAVLLIIIVAVAMSSGGGSGKKKDENPRFGLTESQRKRLFKDMFHAVDEIGSKQQYKACREEWRRLGGERQLNDQQLSEVLAEGLKQGWEQPAMEATMDQTQKTNRLEWIRTMNVSKHDPVLGK